MRRSKEEAAETRAGAVRAAARLVRAKGIAGVSVAEIMAANDRTVGGFYRHFGSKDALVAEAIEEASRATAGRLAEARSRAPEGEALEALMDEYLSTSHRTHREEGCPVAALAADVAREERGQSRKAFDDALERLVAEVAAVLGTPARGRALHTVASLVGAVVLSRASSDPALGDEVAAAVRTGLLSSASYCRRSPGRKVSPLELDLDVEGGPRRPRRTRARSS